MSGFSFEDQVIIPMQIRYSSQEVLGVPVKKLLATRTGSACYETFGIKLASGIIVNISEPDAEYCISKATRTPKLELDIPRHYTAPPNETTFTPEASFLCISPKCYPLSDQQIETPVFHPGLRLKEIIYFHYLENHAHYICMAILENNCYLTTYLGFNYDTQVVGSFKNWKTGMVSDKFWGHLDLKTQKFYRAWTHEVVDPFQLFV